MKKVALLSMFVMLFAVVAFAQCPVEAGYTCVFYGGDFDPNNSNANGLANENDAIVGGNPYGAATYQNFIYAGGTVTGLATNNQSGLNPATAYWEIRSGVSEGNGGTLIASGTGATSNQATGRSAFGYAEYTNFVGNLNVNLDAGTYWMAVVPQDPLNASRSFESNTFGLNAVGTQNSDLQYFNSALFGANFTNADNEGVFSTFSSAVYGQNIPEPSSMIMLGSGLVVAAGALRRRFM